MGRSRLPREAVRVELEVSPDDLLDASRLRALVLARLAPGERRGLDAYPVRIVRRAIDARHGRVRVPLVVELGPVSPTATPAPRLELPALRGEPEALIVGAGPAGLFCALELARHGVRSLVLERGQAVAQRRHAIAALCQRGELDPESNYCFGEGGAGTFSDGKLYTRSHKRGSIEDILQTFVAAGAPEEILVDARPHIGSNRLPQVVTRLREALESAGVEFRFGARVAQLTTKGDHVTGVELADGSRLLGRAVVLATGHSADDMVRTLLEQDVALEAKPFAVGVRVEHAQAFIDRTQFGAHAGHPALGAAAYRLVANVCDTSVYSFCMCPGGVIAPTATRAGQQVVNGWSPSSRRGRFANSGFVTTVGPREVAAFGLDPTDPIAGLHLLARLEQRAYEAGDGAFTGPAQRLSDFVSGRASTSLPASSYVRPTHPARLDHVLGPLVPAISAALSTFETRMPGFAGPEGLAVGVESRTSAPVRIVRDEARRMSPSHSGLFPCGEGAGYAGGIVSAALDGQATARALARYVTEKSG